MDLFIVAMAALPFCMLWQHRCTHTEFTDKMALVCSPTNAIYRMGVIAELLILLSCTICITTYFAIATQCSFPTKPITSIHYREPSHCLTFINLPKSLQNKIFFCCLKLWFHLSPCVLTSLSCLDSFDWSQLKSRCNFTTFCITRLDQNKLSKVNVLISQSKVCVSLYHCSK